MKIIVGIDPGVKTGIAVKVLGQNHYADICTYPIHKAIFLLLQLISDKDNDIYVIFEDARKRKWINDAGKSAKDSRGLAMGAASVKRDCGIWEDFLESQPVRWTSVAPRKGTTKIDAAVFARLTGYTGRTSNHARDAAMLIQGITPQSLKLHFR